jgi:hypothetical protein
MSYGMNSAPTGKLPGDKIPRGYKTGQLQQFTPEQMELLSSLFPHVGPESFLARLAGGDESLFDEIEAPALRQFSGIQGNLASRFSNMGMGARRSSGFQNTSNAAASDFAQQLQSQRQGLQRQAIQDLRGFSESLLNQKPYERFLVEKAPKQGTDWGAIGELGGGILGGAGGFLVGGPAGAMTGMQAGRAGGRAVGGLF